MDLIKKLLAIISGLLISLSGGPKPTPTAAPTPTEVVSNTQDQNNMPTQPEMPGTEPTESGCPQEGHIKSIGSYDGATVTFDNQTAADLKVYWIDFNGKRKFYNDLKAHSKYNQATYVGHVWVVADASGQCLKLESANAVSQDLVIN